MASPNKAIILSDFYVLGNEEQDEWVSQKPYYSNFLCCHKIEEIKIPEDRIARRLHNSLLFALVISLERIAQ